MIQFSYSPINPELVKIAMWKLDSDQSKEAFIPTPAPGGAPPGGGGMPPGMPPDAGMPPGAPTMDPAAMGGAIPPGMPPGAPMPPMGDPGASGMPPMDPAAAGGMPPPPPPDAGMPMTPDMIRQIIREEMGQSGGASMPGASGGAAGGAGKPAKPDMHLMATDIYQMKKLIVPIASALGVPVTPDLLDHPDREQATAKPEAQPSMAKKAEEHSAVDAQFVGTEFPANHMPIDPRMINKAAALASLIKQCQRRS